MDTLFFSGNEHTVLGMYFITPFVLMFGLSIIADLFDSSKKLVHVSSDSKPLLSYRLQKQELRHSRLRQLKLSVPSNGSPIKKRIPESRLINDSNHDSQAETLTANSETLTAKPDHQSILLY